MSTERGVCLFVCIHENTYTYICFRFIQGASIHMFMCMCVLLYVFGNFKDKQFLVVFPSPALSLLLYFSRIANWLFLVHACDFASFCFCLYRKNKSMYTLPARQLMSIQCSHSPLSFSPSTAANPLGTGKQFCLCVCIYVCVYIFMYACHTSARCALLLPLLHLFALVTHDRKSLSQALIISCISHTDALHTRAFAYYCSPHNRRKLANESSQRAPA